jgi:hypothetical protein
VRIVNRNIVGVTFDAHVFVAHRKYRRQAIDGTDRRSTHRGSPAIVKTNFTKTHDQPFLSRFDIDDATANFRCQPLLEAQLNQQIAGLG